MKIVVLDGYTLNPGDLSWEPLKEFGDLQVYDRTHEDEILNRIIDADIVYTNKTPLNKTNLKACRNLKWIGVLATGYNVVDVEATKELDILVSNIPTYGTDAVAQFTVSLLLELCHHIGHHNESVKNGDWAQSKDFCYWNTPLIELLDKTVGIVGFGRIGQTVSRILQAFGMKVIVYTRNPDYLLETPTLKFVALEDLFINSDVISLHCPLFDDTEEMIRKETISLMKKEVLILNTARGQLVHESDMMSALNLGDVAGYATDVVSVEPILDTNPLLKAKNCIITPHIAWAPKEARVRLMYIAVSNLKSFIEDNPSNIVNR